MTGSEPLETRDRAGVRRLLAAWIATLIAAGVIVLLLNSRSRYECNVGASTTGCETADHVLWFLVIAVPGLAVLLGLLLQGALAAEKRRARATELHERRSGR